MGYKQWPYQSAPYKVLDVTPLAAAFNRDPDQFHILNEKGKKNLDSMKNDLNKWREGGKLTEPDVEWWKTHINRERGIWQPPLHHWFPPSGLSKIGRSESPYQDAVQ